MSTDINSDINDENDSNLAPSFPVLALCLENNQLLATLSPSKSPDILNEQQLNSAVEKSGMSALSFDKKAVSVLLEHARVNESFSLQIAEQTDAHLKLKISRDKMTVNAECIPACGGEALNQEKVQLALDEAKIFSECVDHNSLKALIAATRQVSLLVASGRMAVNGVNAKFVALVKSRGASLPLESFSKKMSFDSSLLENESEKINYFDTKAYVAITEGDHLMKRIPATQGTDGINVLGKILKAKKGKNAKFKREKGSVVDPDDENLLIATQKGHPIVSNQSVKVDETLVLPHADLKSGNVNFDGSVLISGHVFPQVKIVASGDIHVKGNVDNATLESGNNIIVGGGVVSESVPDSKKEPKITTILRAKNNIYAMFMNLTEAISGNDIIIQKYVMHSHLKARHDILVGEGGGKGAVICGRTVCGHFLKANVIGSNAYLKTTVECGALEALLKDKHINTRKMVQRKKELVQLSVIHGKLEQKKDVFKLGQVLLDKTKKVSLAISALDERLKSLSEIEIQLDVWIDAAKNAQVRVNKKLYPNTVLIINDVGRTVSREWQKCVVSNKNGNVRID